MLVWVTSGVGGKFQLVDILKDFAWFAEIRGHILRISCGENLVNAEDCEV